MLIFSIFLNRKHEWEVFHFWSKITGKIVKKCVVSWIFLKTHLDTPLSLPHKKRIIFKKNSIIMKHVNNFQNRKYKKKFNFRNFLCLIFFLQKCAVLRKKNCKLKKKLIRKSSVTRVFINFWLLQKCKFFKKLP